MKTVLTALMLVACCFAPLPATLHAQESPPSVSELRRENEKLRQRIDELEAQLAKSQQSINQLLEEVRTLNTRVAELQRQLETRPAQPSTPDGGGEAEPAPPAPVFAELPESQPFAAPESLLLFVRQSYESNFGEITVPFDSAEERSRYIRAVESWSSGLRRTQRSQVEWLVEIRSVLSNESPMVVEYRVLDPVTRRAYSERVFAMQIPARFERRIRESETKTWILRGVAGLDLNINRDRETMGFFDVTPFIGPYVEFAFKLNANALIAAPAPAQQSEQSSDQDSDSDSQEDSSDGE